MITIKHFTASWCEPCKQLQPIMKMIRSENDGVDYQMIDVDQHPDIASEYGIRGVPNVVFEKNGSVVEQVVGLRPKSYYQGILSNIK